jgi:hypothetical protein
MHQPSSEGPSHLPLTRLIVSGGAVKQSCESFSTPMRRHSMHERSEHILLLLCEHLVEPSHHRTPSDICAGGGEDDFLHRPVIRRHTRTCRQTIERRHDRLQSMFERRSLKKLGDHSLALAACESTRLVNQRLRAFTQFRTAVGLLHHTAAAAHRMCTLTLTTAVRACCSM